MTLDLKISICCRTNENYSALKKVRSYHEMTTEYCIPDRVCVLYFGVLGLVAVCFGVHLFNIINNMHVNKLPP